MAGLATGSGQIDLYAAPKPNTSMAGRRGEVATTLFTPGDPTIPGMPYNQPPMNYMRPVYVSDTKNGNTKTDNVTVKHNPDARNRLLKEIFLVAFGMFLCGVPLAVISTLYAQKNASGTTTNLTAATTGNTSATNTSATSTNVTLPTQCTSYITNNDSTRSINAGLGSMGDTTLTAGWYRFVSPAGNYLTTTYVSRDTCTTYYGGSYNGSLPSTAGAVTYGTLCLNNNGYLCYASWSGSSIGVTNCSGYYVYYLSAIAQANARYCTTF